ncbi:MAG: agmatinase [Nitrospinota bacterium]
MRGGLPSYLPRTPFLWAKCPFERARIVLFGCPFDGTASFRPGARFGPEAIRSVSDGLETYSPLLDADLEDLPYCDLGDLPLAPGDVPGTLASIKEEARRLLAAGKIPFALGGEHLVSLPLIEAALEVHPGLVVFQWDAHADLREDYQGAALSHASVMRKVAGQIGPGRLIQFGVRSGTREEWVWMRRHGTVHPLTPEVVRQALARHAGSPIYLTLDLDVLEPGEFPGTGTPEPGGVRFGELAECIVLLRREGARIVALDVVELTPMLDPSGASSLAAAKAVRELLLALPA